ncbi:SpoIIE family protein phosphatase [Streptomyces sp. MMG1121]|uniref:SpoIIE family protein phosphatase n=1 Tax=Streptomyces sp. MMG1121 TaxID=1415544 RepID=UPI0006AF8D82|nr:hypothetical protein ADK64_15010 [Streptomyces sp. MMG1121]
MLGAVEAAARYVPARGHTVLGGAWFDVIPLSGARVALVAGDVAGHGLQAAVAMGRVRTAVRTLADLDLSDAGARRDVVPDGQCLMLSQLKWSGCARL